MLLGSMLLLIAALPLELAGFSGAVPEPSRDVRWLAASEIGGRRVLLAANGVGRDAAASGVRTLLAGYRVDAVVSTGFAGALSAELGVGDAFLAETVMDGPRRFRGGQPVRVPNSVRRGALVTVDRVVQSAQAKTELSAGGAIAVDMESAAVAAVAAEAGVPFYCLRAISDPANSDLPLDFNRAVRRDGSFSAWSLAVQAALRPTAWKELLRLRRHVNLATASLARCLVQCDFGT